MTYRGKLLKSGGGSDIRMRFSKLLLFSLLGILPSLATAAVIDLTSNTSSYSINYTNPSASTVTFPNSILTQVGSGSTNSYYTDMQLTINSVLTTVRMTMTGWTVNASSGNWQRAQLTPFSSGIGVCTTTLNPLENCGSDPQHRVDNNGNLEAVLFQFSNTAGTQSIQVDVNTLYLSAAGAPNDDTDASFWARNFTNVAGPNVSLASLTLAQLQAQWGLNQNLDNATNGSRFVSVPNNLSDTFLLAGRVGQTDDFFKIRGIEINAPNNSTTPGNDPAVPEPSTYATLGAALLALGYYRRKSGK
jgi:hypothetical protein